jgi:hypothetical protein
VERIEVASGGFVQLTFDGQDVFRTTSQRLMEHVARRGAVEPDDPERAWRFLFPSLGLSLVHATEAEPRRRSLARLVLARPGELPVATATAAPAAASPAPPVEPVPAAAETSRDPIEPAPVEPANHARMNPDEHARIEPIEHAGTKPPAPAAASDVHARSEAAPAEARSADATSEARSVASERSPKSRARGKRR